MKKRRILLLIVPLLCVLGLFAYLHCTAVKHPIPVLMYHNVVEDEQECNSMTVTTGRLRKDFHYLQKKGYTPVLPRDLASGNPLPEKPVMITFDDGYVSNYTLLYPILQECGMKAVICPIVCMPDIPADNFCSWDMYREMTASGLVEVGSHTYNLHNLDDRNGGFDPDRPNGIQRDPAESDAEFQARVLDDIQKSHDRIEAELGCSVNCFSFPFGRTEPDAQELIDTLFPVTLGTVPKTASLDDGFREMSRLTVTMDDSLPLLLLRR